MELQTIDSALGKEFPQKAKLELIRENHAAVIRELQCMQDDPEYVSEWQPKTLNENNSEHIEKIVKTMATTENNTLTSVVDNSSAENKIMWQSTHHLSV